MTARSREESKHSSKGTIGPVATAVFLMAVVCGAVLVSCGEDWQESVYTFEFGSEGHGNQKYRIRLTGSGGDECLILERYSPHNRYEKWLESGKDCAWPRVAGGDGWLAGGQTQRVYDSTINDYSGDWILWGIVPAAATEVTITLADGVPHRIATKEAGGGANRIYAYHQQDVEGMIELVAVELRDARGGEVRVY